MTTWGCIDIQAFLPGAEVFITSYFLFVVVYCSIVVAKYSSTILYRTGMYIHQATHNKQSEDGNKQQAPQMGLNSVVTRLDCLSRDKILDSCFKFLRTVETCTVA